MESELEDVKIYDLNNAKTLLKNKNYHEAISAFDNIVASDSACVGEAAYCLGIIYQSGEAAPKDIKRAEAYYRIADERSYAMAAYRLGGIYNNNCMYADAFVFFKKIAENNPSAAYWAYRLIVDKKIPNHEEDINVYLELAAAQGHILAERALAFRYICGRKGIRNIPKGFFRYVKMARNAANVINSGDKLKYQ